MNMMNINKVTARTDCWQKMEGKKSICTEKKKEP